MYGCDIQTSILMLGMVPEHMHMAMLTISKNFQSSHACIRRTGIIIAAPVSLSVCGYLSATSKFTAQNLLPISLKVFHAAGDLSSVAVRSYY